MSEEHSQLRTQMSFGAYNVSVDSFDNSILPIGLTQAEAHAKAKPRFAEFCCSNVEVSVFDSVRQMAAHSSRGLPLRGISDQGRHSEGLLGMRQELQIDPSSYEASPNQTVIFISQMPTRCKGIHQLSTVRNVVTASHPPRFQYFGMWLAYTARYSCTQAEPSFRHGCAQTKRTAGGIRVLVLRFVCFILTEGMCHIIFWGLKTITLKGKTSFYITESSAFRNRVLYFRQDDWRTLCAPLIERLTAGTFEKIPDVGALVNRAR